MCDHVNEPGGREAAMTVIERDESGRPTVWCDPCIAPIVSALNAGGIHTIASCCGHGRNDSTIGLTDGRWLVIAAEPPIAYEHRATTTEQKGNV